MTISELGAIGEFIASIGVFVTLIILVLELKRNTKLLIRSNSREAYLHNGQALETLIDKEGLFPSDQFAPVENSIAGFLSSPGGKDWWKERDVWFGHLFRQKVNLLLEDHRDAAAKAGPVPKK